VPNGDQHERTLWTAITEVQKDIYNLARDGCGHKQWHESTSREIRSDLIAERRDREKMGEKLMEEMKATREGILADTKALRNQILFGMLILLALTLVVDKVLK
jgi:hypothetical protein